MEILKSLENLKKADESIYNSVLSELKRQQNTLELIPSENIVSLAVLEAQGSILTNKYSEGYPNKRYYGGNQFVDEIEQLAIDRAKKLFRAEHCNVQPLSGAIANLAIYFGLLEKGDTILGMDLSHGGHLTHGHPLTHLAKIFNYVRYKTDIESGDIDYNHLREMAQKHKPKMIIAGFSAYSKNLDYKKFREIADEVGAYAFADMCHISGMIAGGALENPLDFGFDVMMTTTHKSLRGPRGAIILSKTEEIGKKIDKSVFPGLQGGPLDHVNAAKAVCFEEALKPEFKQYANQILLNAKSLEKGLKKKNITICFGETQNHLLLLDLRNIEVLGKKAEEVLDECGICCNKNAIPDDPRGPLNPSGLRIGTPAITTRGLKEEDCYNLGLVMGDLLNNIEDDLTKQKTKDFVKEMCNKYKIYSE